jgi:hypothetical protein
VGLWTQIAYGTLVLGICSALHLGLIIVSLGPLDRLAQAHRSNNRRHRSTLLLGAAVFIVLLGHTAQVWIWASAYLWLDALEGLEPAIYFALSNYTTLGYGDLIVGEDHRVFAAFASVNGMLIFGVSTAYLVGLIGRILPKGLQ